MRTVRTFIRNSTGQALVEMALVLFLLLLLVTGIFEFGRAMYTKNTLTHAARAGARAAVVTAGISNQTANANENCTYGTAPNDAVFKATCNSLYSGTRKVDTQIEIQINDLSGDGIVPTPGDMVKVIVTFNNYKSVVPFIPLPNTLTGVTAMRYE